MTNTRGGAVQWGATELAWDGSAFTLVIPAYIDTWPANWLNLELSLRLSDQRLHYNAQVTPAQRGAGGFSEPGMIEIGPIASDLNVDLLHEVVRAAVIEAYETARAAEAQADEWLSQLRSYPSDPN